MGMRIGIAGTGRIGAFHARTLAASPLVDGLLVADVDRARAEQVATDLGARALPSVPALFTAGVDAVVVAASTPAHAELYTSEASPPPQPPRSARSIWR